MRKNGLLLFSLLSLCCVCLCGLVFSPRAAGAAAADDAVFLYPGPNAQPPKTATPGESMMERFLSGPMAGAEEIIFSARRPGRDGHWYANFGYYGPDENRKAYGEGGKLYRLNLKTRRLTPILEDPKGGIRDPQVHYDGRKIIFSWRKGGTEYYHLHEINADGSGLRQLTDGPYDDIEPTYLPDGDIIFVSSRCNRWVNCWLTQVAVLYRCKADGGDIHPISSNNEHDNTPWVLPDGRILYTRWEYVDRSQVHYHHLWAVNPDGTGQMTYYGNLHGGITMIDAKGIPGTDKVVASFSPGHGQREHEGEIVIIDVNAGPDEQSFVRRVRRGANFKDPWAFCEECIMAATGASLVVMDSRGLMQEIFKLPEADIRAGLECQEPRPLRPRPRERVIPSKVHREEATGRLVLADVNYGRNMAGVKRGEVRKLLILETLPKPINYTGGMEPLSYGGTFTLERILGTVPVEGDGSAYFEVPALRSVFFVALDENDLSIKRMQSFVTVQPGEVTSCAGCHEQRVRTPRHSALPSVMATRRPPGRIEPITDVPDVIDFPRDIQPILDRHCLKCHDYDKRSAGMILSGDRGPLYSHSYYAITARSQVSDGRNRPVSNYPPRAMGSSASPLMKKLEPAHHDVKLSPPEKKTVRLWIDSGAAYPGTYAALGTGMIGGYQENQQDRRAMEWPGTKPAMEAIQRRCGACHAGHMSLPLSICDDRRPPWEEMPLNDPRRRISRHLEFNLTRPEKSLILLAPLASSAGGYGACKPKGSDGKPAAGAPDVFANAADPDYVKILAAIVDAKNHLDEIKRFDMPGFRPRNAWVREMKKYGILPGNLDAAVPIDYYALERKYWESLWYKPSKSDQVSPTE